MLICPVCGMSLAINEKTATCSGGHSFDKAREGYVNLLVGRHRDGSLIGDSGDMTRARKSFLSLGHYDFLADTLADMLPQGKDDNILDISCGEGHFTEKIANALMGSTYGFDISKEMIKSAAKSHKNVTFFVANISAIPVKTGNVTGAVQICAPFCEREFARILGAKGVLLSVVPGKRHLMGLKELLYDTPYENNEDNRQYDSLELTHCDTVSQTITVLGEENIANLFRMTPYYYKTSKSDAEKLLGLNELKTEAEFIIRRFVKK